LVSLARTARPPLVLDRLKALRGPGESYSDVDHLRADLIS
jgi:hypothetical protein